MQQIPCPIERFREIDSTSLHARRLVREGLVGGARLLVAERQTGAVGRFGRRWESPAGGLWFTLVWPLAGDGAARAAVIEGLGLRVGLACALSIERAVEAASPGGSAPGGGVRLKWPNDVLVGGRKALGALSEVVVGPAGVAALVGVGVNANFAAGALPPHLWESATTLQEVLGRPIDLEALLDDLTGGLVEAVSARGLAPGTIEAIRRRLAGVGEGARVALPDGSVRLGTLLGLTDDGRLRLADVGGGEWIAPAGAEIAHSVAASDASGR